MRGNGKKEHRTGSLLRGVLLAALVSMGLALLLAAAVLLTGMEDRWITALDQLIKALSIFAGTAAACAGAGKKALRGAACGCAYMTLGIALCCAFSGKLLPPAVMAGELFFGSVIGLLCGMIFSVRTRGEGERNGENKKARAGVKNI